MFVLSQAVLISLSIQKAICVQDEEGQEINIYCALPRCFHCPEGLVYITSFHESSTFSSEFAVCVSSPSTHFSLASYYHHPPKQFLPRSHDTKSSGRFPVFILLDTSAAFSTCGNFLFLHLPDIRCPGFPPASLSDYWFYLGGYPSFPGRTWSLRNRDFSSFPCTYHSRLCICVSALTLKVHLPSCYWYLDKFIFSLKLGSFPVFSNPVGGNSNRSPPATYKTSLTSPSFSSSVSSCPLSPLASKSKHLLKSLSSPSLRTPWVQTITSSLDDFRMAPPDNRSCSIYLNLHPVARRIHVKMQLGLCLTPPPSHLQMKHISAFHHSWDKAQHSYQDLQGVSAWNGLLLPLVPHPSSPSPPGISPWLRIPR